MTEYAIYLRVSTQRQGQSGLGVEAQREIIKNHLGKDATIIAEFVEHESGKRSDRHRKQLKAALDLCKERGATLVIAKIDRLTRNLGFLTRLLERDVPIIACDIPQMQNPAASKFVLQLMANIAEYERELISQRTKDALAAKKARGETLGCPAPKSGAKLGGAATKASVKEWAEELRPIVNDLKKYGCDTLKKTAEGLEARGAKTFRGGNKWALSSVRNLMQHLEVA